MDFTGRIGDVEIALRNVSDEPAFARHLLKLRAGDPTGIVDAVKEMIARDSQLEGVLTTGPQKR